MIRSHKLRLVIYRLGSPYRLLRTPVVYARLGQTLRDAWTATLLRLSSNLIGRRIANGRTAQLRLQGLSTPLFIRAGGVDFLLVRQIFEEGEYEPARGWSIAKGGLLLDLGANIGLATRFFDSVFTDLKIVAVEPDAGNLLQLQQNTSSLIQSGRLSVVQAFAAATPGTAFIDRTDEAWGFRKADTGSSAQGEQVRCVDLPTLLAESDRDTIDLLKCDIEGSEVEVFKNCSHWIGRVKHLIVETHAPYSVDELCDDLKKAGWRFEVTKSIPGGLGLLFARQVD